MNIAATKMSSRGQVVIPEKFINSCILNQERNLSLSEKAKSIENKFYKLFEHYFIYILV